MVEIKEATDENPEGHEGDDEETCSRKLQEVAEIKPDEKQPDRTTMEGMIWNGSLHARVCSRFDHPAPS